MVRLMLVMVACMVLPGRAWASGEWYLLVPNDAEGRVLTSEPLTKWKHEGSYDTAEACKTYKSEMIQAGNEVLEALEDAVSILKAKGSEDDLPYYKGRIEWVTTYLATWATSRCIARYDPRLPMNWDPRGPRGK